MTATHGGKGSRRRKSLVSQAQVDKNWETIKRNNEKQKKASQEAVDLQQLVDPQP